jgi:hypothetical protein
VQAIAFQPMRKVASTRHGVEVTTNEHTLRLAGVCACHHRVSMAHKLQMRTTFKGTLNKVSEVTFVM